MATILRERVDLVFGEWLSIQRSRASLTQAQLADALGVSGQTVSNWEKGRTIPTLTIAQTKKLLALLNTTLADVPDDVQGGEP
jgi:DNA-binding XRE family transcriptional regulator